MMLRFAFLVGMLCLVGSVADAQTPVESEPPSVSTPAPAGAPQMSEAVKAAAVQSLLNERAGWVGANTSLVAPLVFTGLAVVGVVALGPIFLAGYHGSKRDGYVDGTWQYNAIYDDWMKPAYIVSFIAGATFAITATVLWLIRTSESRQKSELERIDNQLKILGVPVAVNPWLTPRTLIAGTSGGLRLSMQF